MGNNPVSGTDPDGGFFFQGTGPIAGTVATAANPSFMLGDAFVIGHRLADGLKSLATYAGMYTVNFWGGAYRGAKETGNFIGGLTPFGGNPSWQQTGQGLLNTAMIISPNPTFTMYKMQPGMQMASYMQDLPNKGFDEISNDMGYGAEKLAEIYVFEKAVTLKIRPMKARGTGKINGFSMNWEPTYGSKPRLDYHRIQGASKKSNSMPGFIQKNGMKLPHYHRGRGNNLHRHRPWEISPRDNSFWDRF